MPGALPGVVKASRREECGWERTGNARKDDVKVRWVWLTERPHDPGSSIGSTAVSSSIHARQKAWSGKERLGLEWSELCGSAAASVPAPCDNHEPV